jgi:glycine/D-amino acid oxidase-like deaminating enzyme
MVENQIKKHPILTTEEKERGLFFWNNQSLFGIIDGFPILGFSPEVKDFLQAAGMCGQGFKLGTGGAELITRLINNH